VDPQALRLEDLEYRAGEAEEHFISFITPGDRLAGFLRLSLPGSASPRTGLADLEGAAIIREIHIYGQSLNIGGESNGAAQHAGLGARLISKAEEISHMKGFQRLAVISAVGTRGYYLRQGFDRGEHYLTKNFG
jgi:elongator complex protein 3